VKAALEYRVRYFVFPTSSEDKQKLSEGASLMFNAKTPEEEGSAAAALKSMRLGQIKFDIKDYRLRDGEQPMSVEWIKFAAVVTLPSDFLVSGSLGLSFVACPTISSDVIENIRNPKGHEYLLPAKTITSTGH